MASHRVHAMISLEIKPLVIGYLFWIALTGCAETSDRIDTVLELNYAHPSCKNIEKLQLDKTDIISTKLVLAGNYLDGAGYSYQMPDHCRVVLTEAGIPFLEVVKMATNNGAQVIGIEGDRGTIEVGKRAGMIVMEGDPSANIKAIYHIETVFKKGIGYNPAVLKESVKGRVGGPG